MRDPCLFLPYLVVITFTLKVKEHLFSLVFSVKASDSCLTEVGRKRFRTNPSFVLFPPLKLLLLNLSQLFAQTDRQKVSFFYICL